MINVKYELTSPYVVRPFYSNIGINDGKILVRPEVLSICKADLRYFTGMRNAKIMKQRLPLVLIHEACGKALLDTYGRPLHGQKVILVPNVPGVECKYGENYREDSLFCSSTIDGFMQEVVALPKQQLLEYEKMTEDIAALTEFVSVGVHAIKSYLKKTSGNSKKIGVWGDGALGYVVCLLLKYYFCQDAHISVIGKHRHKLKLFQFVDEIYLADEMEGCKNLFDDSFECVGGNGSENAIEQVISVTSPEGMAVLMGVSENKVAINTRMILEKGLQFIGRSRSSREDFADTIQILQNNSKLANGLKKIISNKIMIRSVEDIYYAFECAKIADFKILMKWEI